MGITESLCCTAEWHNIVNQLYFNKKNKNKSIFCNYFINLQIKISEIEGI